eukprot:CAMPEP_0119421698 /NCGR_PEP_ID=MMETSP1335-20130426/26479_1 /TAXON_ID=259385 /ORGANISM="Chrysoculter rhomboideus, Strain RCC1486" /LENGTH=95 /DNA_ID=CAMNT_0007447119 /DNA_START=92 /DNA_END=375 /DNA_ORIENTATION=+
MSTDHDFLGGAGSDDGLLVLLELACSSVSEPDRRCVCAPLSSSTAELSPVGKVRSATARALGQVGSVLSTGGRGAARPPNANGKRRGGAPSSRSA